RMGIKDSKALAWQDWIGTAGFDRGDDEDYWGKQWAKAYVDFAAGKKRAWLHEMGVRFFPVVGWAERGGYLAEGHGNSVPRFHIVWGTGPGIISPFEDRVREHIKNGFVTYQPRHRVDGLITNDGAVTGVHGSVLAPSNARRGEASSREVTGEFTYMTEAVAVTSGGIGANHDLIRENWPNWLGSPPRQMITGVPAHVDGRMLAIDAEVGGRISSRARVRRHTVDIDNCSRRCGAGGGGILPGAASMWADASGRRASARRVPGVARLRYRPAIQDAGYDYSWFV